MGSVDEAALKAAVKARRQYIIGNLNTMTLKSCRKTLEEDLGLQAGELKPFKDLLGSLIDRIVAKHKAAEPAAAPPAAGEEKKKPAAGKTKRQPKAAPDSEGAEEGEDEDDKPSKRRKQDRQPAKTSGPRQYSRAVEKLRGICKAATITIPPSLYVKNKGDAALQAALQALLAKHGLDEDAGQNDIQRARNALQVQRDLDGIDTSNIIEGGRRPRRAAANISFKALVEPGSSEEEEEEEEEEVGSGSEDGSLQSDSKAEASDEEEEAKQAGKSTKGGSHASPAGGSDSADEASISVGASEQESSGGEDDAAAAGNSKEQRGRGPAQGVARSPDENVAARGNASGGPAAGQPARKARPAVSLDDSDDEGAPAAGVAKRRALADWSSDED